MTDKELIEKEGYSKKIAYIFIYENDSTLERFMEKINMFYNVISIKGCCAGKTIECEHIKIHTWKMNNFFVDGHRGNKAEGIIIERSLREKCTIEEWEEKISSIIIPMTVVYRPLDFVNIF